MSKKMQRCFNCGEELDESDYHDRWDHCGKQECAREAVLGMRSEREAAHEQLDRDMGWDR